MKNPFIFIEGKTTGQKSQFMITKGVQPTYALMYLKEGSFRLEMEGKKTVLEKGDFAVFSDDTDFFRSVIEPISFVIVKFLPNPACPYKVEVPLGKVEFQNRERFTDSIGRYMELMDEQDPGVVFWREHLLEDILLQAAAENGGLAASSVIRSENIHDMVVKQTAEYIRSHLSEKLSAEKLCRLAGTNPSTLNFKFRKEMSCSVGEYICDERMKLAKRLLSGTTYRIGEVAARCGFENIYYFSTVFHSKVNMTPSEFRKQYR